MRCMLDQKSLYERCAANVRQRTYHISGGWRMPMKARRSLYGRGGINPMRSVVESRRVPGKRQSLEEERRGADILGWSNRSVRSPGIRIHFSANQSLASYNEHSSESSIARNDSQSRSRRGNCNKQFILYNKYKLTEYTKSFRHYWGKARGSGYPMFSISDNPF